MYGGVMVLCPQVSIIPTGSSPGDSLSAAGFDHGHPVSSGSAGQASQRAVPRGKGETAEEHPGTEGTL